MVTLRAGTLTYRKAPAAPDADATLRLTRPVLDAIMLDQTTFAKAGEDGTLKVEGRRDAVTRLLSHLDSFPVMFNIVTP